MPLVLRFAGIWLIYCAWAIACGWVLSYTRGLNYYGYGWCSIVLCIFVHIWWRKSKSKQQSRKISINRLKHYISTPARISWIIVVSLVMLAPMFYHPTNHDAVTYRLPRIYYWLQEESWYWIGGIGYRMDIAGTGYEWMSIPIMLVSSSDRLLYLLNMLPFLMLPGLLYLAGKGVGLRPRASRWWMYILPMAYGIVLQAGSIGNDLLGVVLSVASLAFGQASNKYRPVSCLSFSALAMLIMIGIKITTLPLLLPLSLYWIYQALTNLSKKQIFKVTVIIFPAAMLCSIIPISLLCMKNTGKWNGNPNNKYGIEVQDPIAGIIGNGMNVVAASFYPPVFLNAGSYGKDFVSWLESRSWHHRIRVGNPSYTINLNHELPSEELAGIGCGVTTIIIIWIFGAMKRQNRYNGRVKNYSKIYALTTIFAVVFFLAKVSSGTTARLALSFIPHAVFSLLILFPQRRNMLSERWSLFPMLCLLPALLLNPNRPLIPATVLKQIPYLPEGVSKRMEVVYVTYANRSSLLKSLVSRVPNGETLAFAGGTDHPCNSLFVPLHRIRVMDLNENNFKDSTWIIGTEEGINQRVYKSLESLDSLGYKVVTTQIITDKVVIGPEKWYLLHRDLKK